MTGSSPVKEGIPTGCAIGRLNCSIKIRGRICRAMRNISTIRGIAGGIVLLWIIWRWRPRLRLIWKLGGRLSLVCIWVIRVLLTFRHIFKLGIMEKKTWARKKIFFFHISNSFSPSKDGIIDLSKTVKNNHLRREEQKRVKLIIFQCLITVSIGAICYVRRQ